jgi:hypothetical protein
MGGDEGETIFFCEKLSLKLMCSTSKLIFSAVFLYFMKALCMNTYLFILLLLLQYRVIRDAV